MTNRTILSTTFFFLLISSLLAQERDSAKVHHEELDSIYIKEVQDKYEPDKVLHAEPLYIDLIRDLGARKGEKEWNVGLGLTDNNHYDEYLALVEYEFAPINRLGMEIELPFSIYSANADGIAPANRLNSLKLAAQYSFFVSEKLKTSMAIGYIHEFELTDFNSYVKERLFTGNVYNPFFVAAKRWGQNFHTLLYTGPVIGRTYDGHSHHLWQINSNVHYMIPGTRNFIGIEFNKEVRSTEFDMTIRPQMRVSVADNLLIGIVPAIPINRSDERIGTFLRLIYEPGQRHGKHR
ncbi:HAEPLYID family protein [Olivibacter sitiensis]|uniref:HAEPLYID family protein n=1 Tax=Olivibacter sitiensis TaxID=376470 RepID=UPI000426BC2D|nr:HAEPLYID family protein [Olivibacter sitiensis]